MVEFQHAVHRVVEKLLHTPTVRVKELTSEGHGEDLRRGASRALRPRPAYGRRSVDAPPTTVHHDLGVHRDDASSRHRRSPLASPRPPRSPTASCSATMSTWSRSPRSATSRARPDHHRRTGVFGGHPPGPARRRDRPGRPLAQGPADRARARPRRGGHADAETRATSWSPRRPHPRRAAGGFGDRHRFAAPDGQLGALGLGLEVVLVRGNVDTRIELVHPVLSTACSWPAPGWPASAGWTRPPRPSTAADAAARSGGALAVECREDRADVREAVAAMDDADTRVCVTAERGCWPLEAGCTAPVGALAEVVEGDDGPELRCARSSAPWTVRSSCAARWSHRSTTPSRRSAPRRPTPRGRRRRPRTAAPQ